MVTNSAIESVLPIVIGFPPEFQKQEASRLVRTAFPSLPAHLVNVVVDYVVDCARKYVKTVARENDLVG